MMAVSPDEPFRAAGVSHSLGPSIEGRMFHHRVMGFSSASIRRPDFFLYEYFNECMYSHSRGAQIIFY